MVNPNVAIQTVLDGLVAEGLELGLQVAAYLDGQLVIDAWAGLADVASRRPVDGDTLFTGFSISKGITSTCVHLLADRGLVDYDAPIARYWPEFATRGKARATVRHALTHRVGIPQDPPGFDWAVASDWDAMSRAVAQLEPLWEPGTRTGYHALTYGWMLGEVVRRVDGRAIDQFLREEICRPLEIEGLYFGVPAAAEHRVATLENAPGLEPIRSTFNPSLSDPAATFNRPIVRRAVIPGAGAIVTARALARHYALLAGYGELNGVRLLRPERIGLVTSPELEAPDPILSAIFSTAPSRWGLGYELGGDPGPMSGSPKTFGYAGLGTIGSADPSRRFAFAFLKNRLDWSAREMDAATRVARAVQESLGIG